MARPDVCHLERLQHEPFWDHVPIIQREWNIPPDCAPGAATLLGADGLDLAMDAMHLPSLMSYVQPLAYQYYADAVERTKRIGWRFPSWRSRDPSLVESMTLSSGLHTVWHSFQEALKSAPHCGRRCTGAALLGEALQVLHDALARPSERPAAAEALAEALGAAWPHLREERVPLLRIMLLLPEVASEVFAEDADACSSESLRMLLSASKCQAAAKIALASAPVAQCLRTLRPLWELGVSCLEGYQPLFLSSQRRLTHVLCDEAVLGVPLLDSQVMMHIHGAAGFLQEDSSGQTWLRLEVLHFMSSLDGAVRLTVYGHLKKDRGYYAQALTLPIGLLLRWRCRLSDDDGVEDARLVSFFGYDAIIYCDIPIKKEQVDLLEIRPELLATPGAWTPPPLRLCSAMRPKWRLTACTQPLHTFEKMEVLAPNLLTEFLDYHFLLGIEHITVFDADGSVEESLRRYEANNPGRGQIDYVSHWPLRFGAAHAPRGSENWRPLLFEVEAENHCLWRYRGRADWAVVLHSPDEFLHVVQDPGEGSLSRFLARLEEHRSTLSHVEVRQEFLHVVQDPGEGSLSRFLARLEEHRSTLSHVEVRQDAISMPGRFLYREEGSGAAETASHTIIANVDNFAQAGVHTARPRPPLPGEAPLRILAADPLQELRVNHYVNALDRERCGAKYCASFDDSALWAEEALQESLELWRSGAELRGISDLSEGRKRGAVGTCIPILGRMRNFLIYLGPAFPALKAVHPATPLIRASEVVEPDQQNAASAYEALQGPALPSSAGEAQTFDKRVTVGAVLLGTARLELPGVLMHLLLVGLELACRARRARRGLPVLSAFLCGQKKVVNRRRTAAGGLLWRFAILGKAKLEKLYIQHAGVSQLSGGPKRAKKVSRLGPGLAAGAGPLVWELEAVDARLGSKYISTVRLMASILSIRVRSAQCRSRDLRSECDFQRSSTFLASEFCAIAMQRLYRGVSKGPLFEVSSAFCFQNDSAESKGTQVYLVVSGKSQDAYFAFMLAVARVTMWQSVSIEPSTAAWETRRRAQLDQSPAKGTVTLFIWDRTGIVERPQIPVFMREGEGSAFAWDHESSVLMARPAFLCHLRMRHRIPTLQFPHVAVTEGTGIVERPQIPVLMREGVGSTFAWDHESSVLMARPAFLCHLRMRHRIPTLQFPHVAVTEGKGIVERPRIHVLMREGVGSAFAWDHESSILMARMARPAFLCDVRMRKAPVVLLLCWPS
ncbi:hypothetical protein AK812_SmicGene9471 [Symbiodinium microadriaticum]|uniref:Uncharacterized protein n=1 Tax=Symbiodinium microadriaticum TaxID=2951 RepID=A0A1Q9EIE5_SYMMI|nr:hypothetical protein AK812_SmicGene9471 [Symbiodinium microadriaticum]